MNIDLDRIKLVAGTITAVGAAAVLVWSYQPFATAADLEDVVRELRTLIVQNELRDAEHESDFYTQQTDAYALRILELEARTDLPAPVKNQYLQQLKREQARVGGKATTAQTKMRSLRPVAQP